jgi:tRNA-2-methylthio-N6-dimethylallyladenosine synthase
MSPSIKIMIKNKSTYFLTFGCQMNVYDSDVLKSILKNHNYSITESPESADLIVVNTCSVRHRAEIRALGRIRELKQYKLSNPNLKIAVVGCMAQRMGAVLLKELPFVDLVLGTNQLFDLPNYLRRLEESQIVDTTVGDYLPDEVLPSSDSRHSAFVAISRGCDNFCSYCIVPYVRGKEKHRSSKEIIEEIQKLTQKGYKEITLLGQNVNSYRDESSDFADLLQMINDDTEINWIRFMTSHPRDLSSKLVDKLSNLSKVCEHLHLPLQSGSDSVLQRMNRSYTAGDYLKLVQKVREKAGDLCLTTDIIVGFPGETLSDFQKTLELVKQINFDAAFTFRYSPREGTKAAGFEDDIPEEEKIRRLEILIQLQKEISQKRNNRFIGRELEVLVDGYSRKDKSKLKGKTRTNKTVILDRKEDCLGNFQQAKIISANPWTLFGQLQ